MSGVPRVAALVRALLLLTGLLALGGLASRAWLEGPDLDVPVPDSSRTPDASTRPTPFLLGIVDGLREEATARGDDPIMPFWRTLSDEGVAGVATTGEPTLTAACVRTLLTGRNPDLAVAARNFSAPVVRENLIERLAERGARIGHAGDAAAYQIARPWYRATDVFAVPDQGPADQGKTDDRSVPFALESIAAGVDSLTVHLTRPDHTGHSDGAGLARTSAGALSPYAAACRRTDEQLRAIVEAFRRLHPDALVVLAADHGMTERGTHGGGESAARRAPFVAVGPRVAPRAGAEISQAALASTMAIWLGVAPLAFAESPPALELTNLLPAQRRAALEAYVDARLALASSTGAKDLADAIAVRRAKLAAEGPDSALARLAHEARQLNDRMATTHDLWRVAAALLLAGVLWFFCAHGGADGRFVDGGRRAVAGSLGAFVGLSALAFALKPAFEASVASLSASVSLASAAGLLAGLSAWLLASRPRRVVISERIRSSPALLLVVLGVLIGFPTSLRPFVDPFVELSVPYALLAMGAVGFACLTPRASAVARSARVVAVTAASCAFLVPHVSGVPSPLQTSIVALALGAAAGFALRGTRAPVRSVGALVSALVALAMAAVVRGAELPGPVPYGLIVLTGLGALVVSLRDRGDLALATRLIASIALAFLLDRPGDDAVVRFAILGVGAFAGGRLVAPSTRGGLVLFASLIALLRIAMFHALGGTESFSTVNAGAGVIPGLAVSLDPGSGMSLAIAANVGVQALRYALPWIVLLAMAMRMFERRADTRPGDAPRLVADLAAILSIRGAALVLAFSIWWAQSWWVSTARAVFAFAAADVVLVLASAALVGAFTRSGAGTRVRSEASPAGQGD